MILPLNALEFAAGLYIAGKYFATFDDFLVPFMLIGLFILIQDIAILNKLYYASSLLKRKSFSSFLQ